MNDLVRTAFFAKNVPSTERALRVLVSLGAIVAAFALIGDPLLRWGAVASAAGFCLTGLFGFCPACYLAGRKLPRSGST